MKLIHLSDLHIGKRLNEFSLIEDQQYILDQILKIIDDEAPFGVIIAGDVYDKSIPSAEAVSLFDSFLTKLSKRKLEIFIISGNHDSAERLSFGSEIMRNSGIHISPAYRGEILPISFSDEFGEIDFYLLPFIKPAVVKSYFDAEISNYTDAVRTALPKINKDRRNVLVAHQFVTGATPSESEELYVGGSENVDAEVFSDFDYVALGHIHSAQSCGKKTIRYCGTPLKYSFSEVKHKKSISVIELKEKNNTEIRTVPLVPLRDMHEIRGKYSELMKRSYYENTPYTTDFMRIILTDENDIPNGLYMMRSVYKNLLSFDYDNKRTQKTEVISGAEAIEEKTHYELFEEFYKKRNNEEMCEKQKNYIQKLIDEIMGEEE